MVVTAIEILGVLALAAAAHAQGVPGTMLGGSLDAGRCQDCHWPRASFSHPVGVIPSMIVPAAFPLDGGRITCMTCHTQPHPETAFLDSVAWQAGGRETGSLGPSLCPQCHQGNGTGRRAMHPTTAGKAHMLWSDGNDWRVRPVPTGRPSDNARSRRCLGCHDGLIAPDANTFSSHGVFQSGEHPVDVGYGSSVASARGLHPIATVDPRIRLPDGGVACQSCHSLYSQREDLLVMSNDGSRLCLSCHDT